MHRELRAAGDGAGLAAAAAGGAHVVDVDREDLVGGGLDLTGLGHEGVGVQLAALGRRQRAAGVEQRAVVLAVAVPVVGQLGGNVALVRKGLTRSLKAEVLVEQVGLALDLVEDGTTAGIRQERIARRRRSGPRSRSGRCARAQPPAPVLPRVGPVPRAVAGFRRAFGVQNPR